ncbi:hypothetical protein OGR47_07180 [Methylocystis sp. MJC1]|jgi:hypothetical protein|uniref:hypothetical protein n=1 Tax=Methylocystis sp. MJC1 TaxID=2654282 RepID=UPI0013ED34D2|nr:hypothetical protein [Methylocystis sp. MJC1]KAF2992821.1 hypothetical protein MJC1_00401 [Methylocystis sp. MJC1]MBU6526781.1 hypothetical protein [Methylocystis sp. MJC1]UZX13215.1 hypothetical protein OGR47_07180 [Methylocystis sp. MJC1]
MTTIHISEGAQIDLGAVGTLVKQGKTIISAEDSEIIELVMKTIQEGKTATFYLKTMVCNEITRRYWTPERVETVGLQPIPTEQVSRIKSDFNIEIDGYANNMDCPRCGNHYSTYEFIEQGMKEHGEETVRAVFSLKDVGLLQVHPMQNSVCPRCGLYLARVRGGYTYDYRCSQNNAYACCK